MRDLLSRALHPVTVEAEPVVDDIEPDLAYLHQQIQSCGVADYFRSELTGRYSVTLHMPSGRPGINAKVRTRGYAETLSEAIRDVLEQIR